MNYLLKKLEKILQLKTAAPHIPKKTPHVVEPTSAIKITAPASIESEEVDEIYSNSPKQNLVRTSRRPAVSSNSFKNRLRNNRPRDDTDYTDAGSQSTSGEITTSAPITPASYKKNRTSNKSQKRYGASD